MAIVYLCMSTAVICFVFFVLTVDSLVTSFFAIPLLFLACTLLSGLAAVTVLQRLQLNEEEKINEQQQKIIKYLVRTSDWRETAELVLEHKDNE